MKSDSINYFMGCSSSKGFVSFFSQLYSPTNNRHAYIIKGGAGTGKSTLMKSIATELENRGFSVERIHCSSDPDSLDAVVCRELDFCIADGTSPHVLEPQYPGAVENIINLGDFWDSKQLAKKSKDIIELTGLNSLCHERCARFLAAAGKVVSDTQRLCEDAVLEYKIHAYADRFARRRFKKTGKASGTQRCIFLSALTPKGNIFYENTVNSLADEIIMIEDKTALISGMLFEELKNYAIKSGYDVISAFCPLRPCGFPEHIIIPELSIAFVRKHSSFSRQPNVSRTIHCERFADSQKLAEKKNRLSFNSRIQNELVGEAVASLKEAKAIHDVIEKIYIPTMDFSKQEKIKVRIIDEIL